MNFIELLGIYHFDRVTLKCFQNGEKIIDEDLYVDELKLYKDKRDKSYIKPFALLPSSDTTCTVSAR